MLKYVAIAVVALAGPALAEDSSPWFGNEGQVPFQLPSKAADLEKLVFPAIFENTRMADACAIESCLTAEGSAKVLGADPISP